MSPTRISSGPPTLLKVGVAMLFAEARFRIEIRGRGVRDVMFDMGARAGERVVCLEIWC